MANYFVTQAGAGTGTGLTLGNAKSVANYSAQQTFNGATPGAGDTIFFSGTISGEVDVFHGGTGNGGNRLILDFTAATLTNTTQQLYFNGISYVTFEGGGFWTQGGSGVDSVYHASAICGPFDTADTNFVACNGVGTDITINGFQCIAGSSTANGNFIDTSGYANVIVSNCNCINIGQFFRGDGTASIDTILLNNYAYQSQGVGKQLDLVTFSNSRGIIMQGNKFVLNAPGNASGRHNDLFQCFNSGGFNPSGIVFKYNWLQQSVMSGDGSITTTQLENMDDNRGFGIKAYGNVIYGTSTASTGGFGGGGPGATTYTAIYYQNTYYRNGGPSAPWGWGGFGSMFFRNNVFSSPSSFSDGIHIDITPGATYDYNFFFNWQDPTSGMAGSHGSRTTNPTFTNTAALDFSLGISSTLKSQADTTIGSEFNQGIAYGSTWPAPVLVARGSTWDPGAYQSASSGSSSTKIKRIGRFLKLYGPAFLFLFTAI